MDPIWLLFRFNLGDSDLLAPAKLAVRRVSGFLSDSLLGSSSLKTLG